MLIISLIVLGVPHGALDLYIERKNLQDDHSKSNPALVKYIVNILTYSLLWYLSPLIALVIFILITAYHFGEIDWLGKSNHWVHKLVYFLLGMSWILYFLSVNIKSALKIFLYVGASSITDQQWLSMAGNISVISMACICAIYFLLFFKKSFFYHHSNHFYFSLLQLVVLIFVCRYCSLWIGFGFYFGLWHSILSFDKIRLSFEMPDKLNSWMELIKKALPFSIMAWIGMLFIMFMFYNSKNSTSLVTLLFITLSVLTLPHLQVFTKLKINLADK